MGAAAGSVGRDEGDGGIVLAFETDEGPATETSGVSTVCDLMGQKGVMD